MFEQLNSRFAQIIKNIKGQGKITEQNISDALRDVRRALLEADVNFQVAKSFVNSVKDKAAGGDERLKNLWALCPNCHRKKTRGVITIDIEGGTVEEEGRPIDITDKHLFI